MLNALIVVWRESLEAMLVIGVLFSWIARQPDPHVLRKGVWGGVAGGALLACALAYVAYRVQSEMAGQALDLFQLGMVLTAAVLIVQMVLWMHRNGKHMKREIETRASASSGVLGLALITALAIAREGSETVIFLYGISMDPEGGRFALQGAALLGFALAMACSFLVVRFARHLNIRIVFLASEVLLLLIAHALLSNAVDRLIALDWVPPLIDPVWDLSAWLPDGEGAGRFMADFLGYRARPTGVLMLISVCYWSYAIWRMRFATDAKV